ncbi:glycoside hydrolase family 71/99-like protein [Tenacibaculum maritimum]|uniref:glycoside hydrolase family 71/99-like protein n=2 Tax=Tenacibaculum maritimum TaxID=107401 RepID=UPI00388F8F27
MMKRNLLKSLTLFLIALTISCTQSTISPTEGQSPDEILEKAYLEMISQRGKPSPPNIPKHNPKKVYIHYMPWFYSMEHDGFWGQHWTMTNKNPDIMDSNGKREIASHYYPLIGPYSSNDDDLQEYHLLLMKLSGIDGVIFDWYGSRDVHDYQDLKNSTESFIDEIEEVGLEFAIMYEDKAAKHTMTQEVEFFSISAAISDLEYIQNTYFTSDNYIKINGSELLFIFGPDFIIDPLDWELIVSHLDSPPFFMSLWKASNRLGKYAGGEFSWVDTGHMNTLFYYYEYSMLNNIKTVGGIYPRFNDFYDEGGWGTASNNDWDIFSNGSQVLDETLALTHAYPVEFIQIITWNDFGEGTMIEPTEEFGFSLLERIQSYTGVQYTIEDLQLPYKLYLLRKKHKNDARLQTILNRAYQALFMLDLEYAEVLLSTIQKKYSL